MEAINLIIAKKLKAFREDKKLSLERVSELTGVAKQWLVKLREVSTVEIEPGGFLSADAHKDDTKEFLTVFDGVVTIGVDDIEYTA